jgi:hypothetical protein
VAAMIDNDSEVIRFGAGQLDTHKYDGVLIEPAKKARPIRKNFLNERMDGRQIDFWLRRYAFNIGVLMGQLRRLPVAIMAVDYESAEARERVRAEFGLPESPMVAKTARGFHAYYRTVLINQKTVIGWRPEVDLKFTGYCLAPPSWRADVGFRYEWESGIAAPGDLPVFPGEILAEPKADRKTTPAPTTPLVSKGGIHDLRKYIHAIPSVMGQNGNRGLMRVCYVLAERLSWTDALAELQYWNACVPLPEWGGEELVRALTSAFKLKRGG